MEGASIGELLSPSLSVQLYGSSISDMKIEAATLQRAGVNRANFPPMLALIRALKINNHCRKLKIPAILTVFGPGDPVQPGDECAAGSEKVWSVKIDEEIASVSIEQGTLLDLLEDIEDKGIKGSVKIKNVRYDNGKIRGTIEASAKITVFGKTAKFKENVGFSIPVGGCHTVFDAGIGKIKVCFKAPNRVCAELCVGKWGIEKCWDACVTVALPALPDFDMEDEEEADSHA